MIIDSLDDLDNFDARQYVPRCEHGTILITSSLSNTAKALDARSIEIEGLADEAGAELLLSRLDPEFVSESGGSEINSTQSIVLIDV